MEFLFATLQTRGLYRRSPAPLQSPMKSVGSVPKQCPAELVDQIFRMRFIIGQISQSKSSKNLPEQVMAVSEVCSSGGTAYLVGER